MRKFARQRQQYTVQNIINHFGLSGASNVTVNLNIPNSGLLKILDNKIDDGFQGTFFNDVPVHISATPYAGFKFSHWEARSSVIENYDTSDIALSFTEDITLTAHFNPDTLKKPKGC